MPGIRRLQPGYSSVGMVDFHNEVDEDKPRPQYCVRCKDLFRVYSLLGPRVIPLDKLTGKPMPKPADHDNWLECLGCGTVYGKYEVKQEAHLTTLVDPDNDPFDRDKNIIEPVRERRKFDSTGMTRLKKKRNQQLNNMKDGDLKHELETPGTELVSYEVSGEY
jgi:hypothetical protein